MHGGSRRHPRYPALSIPGMKARLRRTRPLGTLTPLAVLLLGASACAGEEEREQRPTRADTSTQETVSTPAPPPAPETAIRVLDGDSRKPVGRARVVVAWRLGATASSSSASPAGARPSGSPRPGTRLVVSV
jgi:hypothetical protein